MARGKETKAKEVILAICAGDSFETCITAATMLADIQQAVEIEDDTKPAYKELFVMGPLQYFRRVLLAFGVQSMQQLTGISKSAHYMAWKPKLIRIKT